jgi:hypothetical protein
VNVLNLVTKDPNNHQRNTQHSIPVHLFDNGKVDVEWANLSRFARDQIIWISMGPEFTIELARTPFVDQQGNPMHSFTIPAGERVLSGPAVDTAEVNQTEDDTKGDYKYTVRCEAMSMAADPGFSITP